jgi:hypothetical protein
MKVRPNRFTQKDLNYGGFWMSGLSALVSLGMAFTPVETINRYSPDTLADPKGNIMLKQVVPSPLSGGNSSGRSFWLLLASTQMMYGVMIFRGKRLAIYKDGNELEQLPKEVDLTLINKGYLPKSEPLLFPGKFADDSLEFATKFGQHFCLSGLELIQDGLMLGVEGVSKPLKVLADYATPPEVKSWFESKLDELDQGYAKFKTNSIHAKITGGTGSGKTFLSWDYLASWVERHQGKGQVLIGDVNYLKPDNKGFVNDWLGIDNQRVYDTPSRIIDLFGYLNEELDRRVKLCQSELAKAREKNPEARQIDINKLEPMLVLIDEYSSLVSDIITLQGKDWLNSNFYPLIKQCRAYKMQFLLIDQTNAKNQSEMPMAIASQFSKLIIAKGDIDDSELKYLGVTGDYKTQLLSQVEQLVSNGKDRVAIAQIGEGKAKVINIPDLSDFNYRFPSTPDHVRWLDQNKSQILKMIDQGKSLTAMSVELNINQRSNDPIYQILKDFYQSQKTINLAKIGA